MVCLGSESVYDLAWCPWQMANQNHAHWLSRVYAHWTICRTAHDLLVDIGMGHVLPGGSVVADQLCGSVDCALFMLAKCCGICCAICVGETHRQGLSP